MCVLLAKIQVYTTILTSFSMGLFEESGGNFNPDYE